MKDEEITAIAKQIWGENLGIGDGTSAPVGFVEGWCDVKPTSKIIAFARFIADLQKEKDAKICENEKIDLAATCNIRELTYNAAIEHCINAIRSPETDLDESLRRQ